MSVLARSPAVFLISVCALADSRNLACAPCHAAIVRAYATTAMAKSSGVMPVPAVFENLRQNEFRNNQGTAEYRVATKADGLYFSVRQGDITATRRLEYFIGSGAAGRSYLTRVGTFLFQAPVSYYSAERRWQVSPGYERSNDVNLNRPIEPSCLNCHASRIQAVAGTRNGYAAQPFLEDGISCERCHGPGERHMQRMKAGITGDKEIVNPAKLEAVRRGDVCAQCHLAGEVRIAKVNQAHPYQPGDLLSDHSVTFLWNSRSAVRRVNGHFEGLAQSRCHQASGEKMWCGTCHDPHRQPAAAERVAYYRKRCLSCHTPQDCKLPSVERERRGDDCTACHMPRSDVRDVQHATFTDHSIPRDANQQPSSERRPELIAFGGQQASVTEEGLAYAFIALRDNDRILGGKAFELLQAASAENPSDSKVATQLAQLFDKMGNDSRACELYERASVDPEAIAAAINHGNCLARNGRAKESIAVWQGVLKSSPGEEGARLNIAVALYQSGDLSGAEAQLRETLRLNPMSSKARQLLNEITALAK